MSLHVGMDCKCCIHPPFQNAGSVSGKDQCQRVQHAFERIFQPLGEPVCSNHPCQALAMYWVLLICWCIVSWPPGCETLQFFRLELFAVVDLEEIVGSSTWLCTILPYQKHQWSHWCSQTSRCSLGHEWCSPKSFRDMPMARALKVECARNGQAKHTYIHTCGLCICWLSFVLIHPQRYFYILGRASQSCYH